jgi:multimeric flavodoxin WrbA
MPTEIKVAVVYHSGYGHTARQAEAVERGAASVEGVETLLISVDTFNERWADLEQSDAIVFGAPTYMGTASAQFKAFLDAASPAVFAAGFKWKDKVAAGFTNSASRSGDKLATLIQFAVFAGQMGMHWVNLGLPPGNNVSTGTEDDLNRLGFFMGAGAQSNFDEGPENNPRDSDLRTAEHLGRRVAEVTQLLARGRKYKA